MSEETRYVPWAPVVKVLDPEISADQTKAKCRILVQNFGEGEWVQAGLVEVPLRECQQQATIREYSGLLQTARTRAFELLRVRTSKPGQFC